MLRYIGTLNLCLRQPLPNSSDDPTGILYIYSGTVYLNVYCGDILRPQPPRLRGRQLAQSRPPTAVPVRQTQSDTSLSSPSLSSSSIHLSGGEGSSMEDEEESWTDVETRVSGPASQWRDEGGGFSEFVGPVPQ